MRSDNILPLYAVSLLIIGVFTIVFGSEVLIFFFPEDQSPESIISSFEIERKVSTLKLMGGVLSVAGVFS